MARHRSPSPVKRHDNDTVTQIPRPFAGNEATFRARLEAPTIRERLPPSADHTVLDLRGPDFQPPPVLHSLWQPSTAAFTTLTQIDHALHSEDDGGNVVTTAHPLPAYAPPNWALRCTAGRASNVEQHLLEGARMTRSDRGLARCRNISCPYCHGEVMGRHQRVLTRRVESAMSEGLAFVHVVLTVPSVLLGALHEQRRVVADGVARGLRSARRNRTDELFGHLYADHITFHREHGWHAHRHLLLVGSSADGVIQAALKAEEMFAAAVKRDIGESRVVVHIDHAPDPAGLVAYFTKPWSTTPSNDGSDPSGSLSPFGLAANSLRGDFDSRTAYLELVDAICRRSLFRGSGRLGVALMMGS